MACPLCGSSEVEVYEEAFMGGSSGKLTPIIFRCTDCNHQYGPAFDELLSALELSILKQACHPKGACVLPHEEDKKRAVDFLEREGFITVTYNSRVSFRGAYECFATMQGRQFARG